MPNRILVIILAAGLILQNSASANVIGSDAQNFNPTTGGLDFVTVHSSETLEPGVFNLGLFANYGKNPFPFYESVGGESRKIEGDNSLTGGDLNMGVGLMRGWDVGVSFPFILNQEVSNTQSVGYYSQRGNTEIRPNTKLRLFGGPSGGLALIASANFNNINNNPYLGQGGGPIYNFELAADTTISQFALALNVGYRLRNPGTRYPESGIEPIPNQMIASGALSYLMQSVDTKLIFEVLSAFPEVSNLTRETDREYAVTEALLGLKHDWNSKLSFHLGAGRALVNGISSPEFRAYAGLNISFGGSHSVKSVQADPYDDSQRAVRMARTRQRPIERPRPQPTMRGVAAAPPPAPKVVEEPPAAVKVEKISNVQVFDRGSYKHIVLNNIEFEAGTGGLVPESKEYVSRGLVPALRELLRRRPVERIIVEGHTDSIGGEDYNLKLSEQRARLVQFVLKRDLGLNIPIEAVGMGESYPIADNGNYQGRSRNRRVELKIHYKRAGSPQISD